MPVNARSKENNLDFAADEPGQPNPLKSKSQKSTRSRGKNTKRTSSKGKRPRKNALEGQGQKQQADSVDTSPDLIEGKETGSFTDLVVGGPSNSEYGGMTKHASLPSAPLVDSALGPSAGSGEQRYSLLFVNTPDQSLVNTRLPLDFENSSPVTIGRDSGNQVVIPDQVVSRSHAELSMQDGRIYLKDHQSTNGTFLYDGSEFRPVHGRVEIQPDSVIRFGTGTIVKLTRE